MNEKGVIFQLRTVCEFCTILLHFDTIINLTIVLELKKDCGLLLPIPGTNFKCYPVWSTKRHQNHKMQPRTFVSSIVPESKVTHCHPGRLLKSSALGAMCRALDAQASPASSSSPGPLSLLRLQLLIVN